ncbi:DUF2887 domain-containing protein [Tumidithrix elongata]|uniref:DUF2887 domain-containing protein n=1 Tax=Tumidithrix elongata TaxID=3088357 RepID=UPI0038CDB3B2
MKTDTLFYTLFKAYPAFFFELIGQDPQQFEGYQFLSVELKQGEKSKTVTDSKI